MSEFKLMGLPMAALWPRTAQTKQLTNEQIAIAKGSIKMTEDVMAKMQELDKVLSEHAAAIAPLEGFLAEFVKRAEAVDPTQLQAFIDRIKDHTSRLAALMAKFPLIK